MPSDWYRTPSGADCPWCNPNKVVGYEPFDLDEAMAGLCLGHAAEWAGESIDSLLRAESAARADMAALGFFDR